MLSERYMHSATGANMMMEDPAAFLVKYGFGYRQEANGRMNMGLATETATNTALHNNLSDEEAEAVAVQEFDDLMDGEVAEERDWVGPITKNFLEVLRPRGRPLTYQSKRSLHLPGLERKVICYTDFGYDDVIIDTKATKSCPTSLNFKKGNVRQQAVYSKVWDKPVALLYATPKKHAYFDVNQDMIDEAWNIMLSAWRRIERWDRMFATADDATEFIPLNTDSFYWNAESRGIAIEKWRH